MAPLMRKADSFPSIHAAFFDLVASSGEAVAYRYPEPEPEAGAAQGAGADSPGGTAGAAPSGGLPPPRRHLQRSRAEVGDRVRRIAEYFRACGVRAGTTVAVLSGTRPEWLECDMAILAAGGVAASVYQSLPAHDVAYILFDSGARIVVAENEEQLEKLRTLRREDVAIPATEDRPASTARIAIDRILMIEPRSVVTNGVLAHGSGANGAADPKDDGVDYLDEVLATTAPMSDAHLVPRTANDLATLVYTSGTTGPPKGVMQTHGNHLANIRQAFASGLVREGLSMTLFLPLAHSFARLMGYVGLVTDVTICFPAVVDRRSSRLDPSSITRDIREFGSNCVPLVPRFLEKMRDGVLARSRKTSFGARLLRLTLWAARENAHAIRDGRVPSMRVQMAWAGTSGVRTRIKEGLFGSNFEYAVSGGAKLPLSVAEFFDAIEVTILEGYGLTETCVATNANRKGHAKLGTVGPVLDTDIELKLLPDGEILFRGPNVAKGYLNRPTATAASWDEEGWFHTGDLGSIDDEGFLTIRGRKKELFKTSGGKYIAPHDIEDQLKAIPLISNAVLSGDGRPFCVALVTLDAVTVKEWAEKTGRAIPAAPHTDPDLEAAVRAEIDKVNRTLPSFETIKAFYILPEELTVDNGLMTPSYKVKRGEVEKRYSAEIDALYERTVRRASADDGPPII